MLVVHFFSGCIVLYCNQDLPWGVWCRSEKCHDRLDDSECHDNTAQIGVYACPLWIIQHRLESTVEMKLIRPTNFDSTNFMKQWVTTGNSFSKAAKVQGWWIFILCGAGLAWNRTLSAGHTQEVPEALTDTWQEGYHRCPCWVTNVSLVLGLTDGYTCRLEAQIKQHLQINKTLDRHCTWLIPEEKWVCFSETAQKDATRLGSLLMNMGYSFARFFILRRQHVGLTHWQCCWTVRGVWWKGWKYDTLLKHEYYSQADIYMSVCVCVCVCVRYLAPASSVHKRQNKADQCEQNCEGH